MNNNERFSIHSKLLREVKRERLFQPDPEKGVREIRYRKRG